ncbi:microcystin degradation protein MlrC [Enemella evansiae]|uniref:Microcystin degradation protein MlrC n=1 Tax=Enemella evansiae TaxID=2016499 RepID=A0A255GQQ6_9ACTN|nr:M81 family metallopeptidase [Enemella evansiae]OYO16723.1 microcystin degradation protein MlrC [Enemella evansiae]
MSRPRIAICGVHIESSTFSPHRSTADDFEVRRGAAVLERYPWIGGNDWADRVEWLGVLHARALPGGPVVAEDYQRWRAEILAGLAELGELDGLFFDIHGAMSVEGMTDVEGELITAIRSVIGTEVLVSTCMDLHGNVSEELFAGLDLLTCYRMAPHEDAWQSRERAARNLVDRLIDGSGKPHKALVHVPVLLPGEMTSTRIEPAKSLYGRIPGIEAKDGILDAAIWIGFAWADEPRCCGAVVVTGDDPELVNRCAEDLGAEFLDRREEFVFVAPTASYPDGLRTAITSEQRPFLLSDSGDNPGAGGAADCTVTLAELLSCPEIIDGSVSAVLAAIVDPEAARRAAELGVGAPIDTLVGGRIDDRPPGSVRVRGVVGAVVEDPDGGLVVRLDVGGLQVVVTSRRSQYSTLDKFHRLGIDPAAVDVITVKIGYLEPELYDLAADWLLCLTPGGVDQDLVRLGHQRLHRPMFPFDRDLGGVRLQAITS